jgi:hypothetical protein
MRRLGVAVAACAFGLLAGTAGGQSSATTNPKDQPPAAMPGQVVGTPLNLNPIGNPVNKAVPSRGELKKLESPLSRPYDPGKPLDVFKGTNLDPKQVMAPVAEFPQTPNQNLLERLYDKLETKVTSMFRPTGPVTPTYTPGIFRRDKQRAMNRMWRGQRSAVSGQTTRNGRRDHPSARSSFLTSDF